MSTAYNQFNDEYAALEAERTALKDPAGTGTVYINKVNNGILQLSTAGTVTLDDPTNLPVGIDVLVLAQASVTVQSIALADGEWAVFKVVKNSSDVNVWALVAGSAVLDAVADLGVADFSVGSYPIAFGTITLNSGDSVTNVALKKIADALIASGLATGTITAT